jgi:hypothetical protein
MPMSLSSELADLIDKHRALEKELQEAMAWSGSSDTLIADIKRRKLRVKDAIMQLERQSQIAA